MCVKYSMKDKQILANNTNIKEMERTPSSPEQETLDEDTKTEALLNKKLSSLTS